MQWFSNCGAQSCCRWGINGQGKYWNDQSQQNIVQHFCFCYICSWIEVKNSKTTVQVIRLLLFRLFLANFGHSNAQFYMALELRLFHTGQLWLSGTTSPTTKVHGEEEKSSENSNSCTVCWDSFIFCLKIGPFHTGIQLLFFSHRKAKVMTRLWLTSTHCLPWLAWLGLRQWGVIG